MSIKGLFQGIQKDQQLKEMQEKIKALEKQVKKINTLEVYMKRFMKVEENLELLNLKEKISQKESTKQLKIMENFHKEEFRIQIENQILLKVQHLVTKELEPFQQMMKELYTRITNVEYRLLLLEGQYQDLVKEEKNTTIEKGKEEYSSEGQPIIFQEIHVDKLFMDKYEQTNNLGQLGIKELSGHLNIGATYDKGVIPHELLEEWKKEMNSLNQLKKEEANQSDAVNDEMLEETTNEVYGDNDKE